VSIGTWNKCGKFCTNIIAVVLYRKKVANDYLTETLNQKYLLFFYDYGIICIILIVKRGALMHLMIKNSRRQSVYCVVAC